MGCALQADSAEGLSVAGNTAVTVLSGGNVGIGTTAPGSIFEIGASGTQGRSMRINSSGSSQQADITFDGATDLGFHQILFNENGSSKGSITYRGTEEDIAIRTGGAAIANIRMTIDSDGNVGIGTTNPEAKLQVIGGPIAGRTAYKMFGRMGNALAASSQTLTLGTMTDDGMWVIAGTITVARNSGQTGTYRFIVRRNNSGTTGRVATVSSVLLEDASTVAPTLAFSGDSLQITISGYYYCMIDATYAIDVAPTTFTLSNSYF